ncbi:oligodendrocyte-myelin glycoprotein-like isoform X1 [Nelusetta ayraudi]|uniref:oligodendrocyte-myelin glycoprotein-like isoform X1 n=1 Tax=Nelusetta ayraudi TaxID=303726 RepID=UPI003F6F7708
MRSRYVSLRRPSLAGTLLQLLLALSLCCCSLAACPPACSCSGGHREVDCSHRGLRQLPGGLQHNVRSLDLSHNRLHGLDGQLSAYTHLRLLDLSHNQLSRLPAGLPRSLWQLHASFNWLRLLEKDDTAHQWNLRVLDVSGNRLQRAVFINNTLASLCTLNLSHNHFWTLPTNMPGSLVTVDLSHNLLAKVLPGSLDQLVRLDRFYVHANRLSALPAGALDQLRSLSVISLGGNPWACHLQDGDVNYLLSWSRRTSARVLGCPCHSQPVCGGEQPGRLTSSPIEYVATGAWDLSDPSFTRRSQNTPGPGVTAATIDQSAERQQLVTSLPQETAPPATERVAPTDPRSPMAVLTLDAHRFLTPEPERDNVQTRRTTTLRTRSVRRLNQPGSSSSSSSSSFSSHPRLHKLGLLCFIMWLVM